MAAHIGPCNIINGDHILETFKHAKIELQETPVVARGRCIDNHEEWVEYYGRDLTDVLTNFNTLFPFAHAPTAFWVVDSRNRVHFIHYRDVFENGGIPAILIIREDHTNIGVVMEYHQHQRSKFFFDDVFSIASFILD